MNPFRSFLRDDRGFAAVVFTVALVPLMGMVGLTVDYARGTTSRSGLQNAVDAAALAAVRTKTLQSGQRIDVAKSVFEANKPDDLIAVPAVDASSKRAVVSASVEVPTTLMRLLNQDSVTVSATATAVKLFDGPPPCVFALNKTANPAIDIGGNASFTGKNCALQANSSATGAIQIGGSSEVKATGYCAVGTVTTSRPLTPEPESFCDELPDPYANLVKPDNRCDYQNKMINQPLGYNLPQGYYCGGLTINADTVLSGGLYVIDGTLSIGSQAKVTGTGVTFYLKGRNAGFKINGGSNIELSAMDWGPYAGLLIVQDRDSNPGATNTLNGNAGTVLVGGIYTPTQSVTLNGTGQFGQGSPYMPIIADTVKISGNNTTHVEVDGSKLPVVAPLPKLAGSARLEN